MRGMVTAYCSCPRPTARAEEALDRVERMRGLFIANGMERSQAMADLEANREWLLGIIEKEIFSRRHDSRCIRCLGVVTGLGMSA